MVSWGAIGFNQKISSRISTTIYIGGSEQSDPINFSALKKPAVFVLNQETLFQFNKSWQTAFGASVRLQDLYQKEAPYTSEEPAYRKETRYYLRLFFKREYRKTTFTYSFRPEYRVFFTPDGDPWPTPLQVRLRLKAQINIPVNTSKSNQIIVANEWLTATSKNSQSQWSTLEFTEDRLSTFFRHTFHKPSVFLDVGLMHQFWRNEEKNFEYTTYLSFDLLFQNPFGKRSH